MKYLLPIFLLCLMVVIPVGVSAETVLRVGGDATIKSDEVVDRHYYVSAGVLGKVSMEGEVANDMVAAGRTIEIYGEIGDDLSALATNVQLYGSVGDDARIVAGEVVIRGDVGGDLVVIGGMLKVEPTATIGGDVFIFTSRASIEGEVSGSVFGTVDQLSINGAVNESVDVKVKDGLVLGGEAFVGGDIRHTGGKPVRRSAGSEVVGDVIENTLPTMDDRERLVRNLIPLLVLLFSAWTAYLFSPRGLQRLVLNTIPSYGVNGLIGFLILFVGTLASLVMLTTVLGLLLGIIAFAFLVVLLAISLICVGVLTGAVLARLVIGRFEVSPLWITAGVLTSYSLLLVSVVGPILFAFIFVVALGGLAKMFFNAIR